MSHSRGSAPKPSSEAFWWSLFSAGGVLGALFIPVIVVITGFLLPTDDRVAAVGRYDHLRATVGWWPVRIVLFGVIALCFFHCMHRIRHTLMDLGLRGLDTLLKLICYGGAFLGTAIAAVILLGL